MQCILAHENSILQVLFFFFFCRQSQTPSSVHLTICACTRQGIGWFIYCNNKNFSTPPKKIAFLTPILQRNSNHEPNYILICIWVLATIFMWQHQFSIQRTSCLTKKWWAILFRLCIDIYNSMTFRSILGWMDEADGQFPRTQRGKWGGRRCHRLCWSSQSGASAQCDGVEMNNFMKGRFVSNERVTLWKFVS